MAVATSYNEDKGDDGKQGGDRNEDDEDADDVEWSTSYKMRSPATSSARKRRRTDIRARSSFLHDNEVIELSD